MGLGFIVDWLWDKRHTLPRLEWLVVAVILAVIIVEGYLAGIVVGLVLAAVLFALSFMTIGFGVIIPITGALVALLAAVTVRAQQGGVERPKWPWERDDEE